MWGRRGASREARSRSPEDATERPWFFKTVGSRIRRRSPGNGRPEDSGDDEAVPTEDEVRTLVLDTQIADVEKIGEEECSRIVADFTYDNLSQEESRLQRQERENGLFWDDPEEYTPPDSAKQLCSSRRAFGAVLVATFVAASVLTTVLTKPVSMPLNAWGHFLPIRGIWPSEPADNMTLRRIPLVLPPLLHRAFATSDVNRSTAKGLLQGIAQDIQQETRARAINEWASQGGLIDVPVRDAGPQCKQGSRNCEWEVVSVVPIHVRQRPNSTAPTLGMKAPGAVVVGREENEAWLRLAGEAGFIAFEMNGSSNLNQREDIWYEKIVQGSCADIGRRPILDGESCQVAALTLGLAVVGPFDKPVRVQIDNANGSIPQGDHATAEEVFRRMVETALEDTDNVSVVMDNASVVTDNASVVMEDPNRVQVDDGSRPEGCYMDAVGTLRMNLHPDNIGNGVRGDMQPICATMAYPSTNTTTSTTATGTTSTRSYGWPSFTCFSYMMAWTTEEKIIQQQLWKGAGIFACEHTIVLSSEKRHLGKTQYGEDVWTWKNPPVRQQMGDLNIPGTTTNSWLNSLTFITAFNTILHDSTGRVWSTDFFVKADPDAILLPDRLRKHVQAHVGAPVYFLNCDHGGGAALYGAVEIYSKEAMQLYKDGHNRCLNNLNWHGWGEDTFFSTCFDMLGAQGVADVELVGDARCNFAPCSDPWRAAFHPFKDVGSWITCWRQATNNWN